MSETVKLIISIDSRTYNDIKVGKIYSSLRDVPLESADAIRNGIPLDDVKAEIAEEICLTNNPYTKETKYTIEHLRLIEILDNIGKAESEG